MRGRPTHRHRAGADHLARPRSQLLHQLHLKDRRAVDPPGGRNGVGSHALVTARAKESAFNDSFDLDLDLVTDALDADMDLFFPNPYRPGDHEATPHAERLLYSEAGGFVLLDVEGIEAVWVDPSAAMPRDLLERLSDEQEVARAEARAALLPIVVDDSDEYRLEVHLGPPSETRAELRGDESGWRFTAGTRGQQLVGIGHLARWQPDLEAALALELPPGDYEVRCRWWIEGDIPVVALYLRPWPGAAPRPFPIAVDVL